MKKLSFILLFLLTTNNVAYADLKTLICENVVTKNKANIVYSKNFAKEEMSPNIWLFFQKVLLDNKNLKIVSEDDEKTIREWQIDLQTGKATLTPMFDPSSNWLCLNTEKQLIVLNNLYKSGALSGYEFEKAKKKLLNN